MQEKHYKQKAMEIRAEMEQEDFTDQLYSTIVGG